MAFHVPEDRRVAVGRFGSDASYGNNGAFDLFLKSGRRVYAICSDGEGWEHVSVTLQGWTKCPSWDEMCELKDLFWGPEDTVMQLHPPRSRYVNVHPFCLHLWRPVGGAGIPQPPSYLVG